MSGKTLNLPFDRVRLKYTTADGYFYKIMNSGVDYVINIDEDAFLIDRDAFLSLLKYCIEMDYDNCGFPDGGVLPIRKHNPLVTNAFFNIINVKKIKSKF